ncbi:hypothetical protein LEM8419_03199 [Neolewinella maritima]|uniref:DUF4292 domain-containing protein n=1 Tax=Neolewinella maritima TaxID=1383882 RepID=A0ABM9B4K9_9BACT|nr:DUF4292 domain-containing protein [Neolewinella maritima]CAH1002280.1 hypothetical protein LEM8419_03199 [Neolewinella maritima]
MRLSLLALLAVLLFANCSRKTTGAVTDGTKAPTGKLRLAQVLRTIDDNRSAPEWMDAKARVDLDSEKLNIGGTAYIRLHRDEAIWMSVKKFGFEGARALIRPDSFFLYNRLEGEYIAEPLSYIEEKYKIPARFDLLQEIFFGNAVFLTDDLEIGRADDGAIRLTGRSREFATQYYIDPVTYRPQLMELQELGQDRSLSVMNTDYSEIEGVRQTFPRGRLVAVDGGKEGTARMEMEFTDVSFSGPVAMPFEMR